MRKVLLITSNHNLISLWEPLAKVYDLCILGPQAPLAQDMGLGEVAFPIGKYATAEVNEKAINKAYEIAAEVSSPNNVVSIAKAIDRAFDRLVGQKSDSMPDAIFKFNEWWPAMVGEHVRQEVVLIELLKGLIAEREVVGCIVHEDVSPDMRVLVQFCKGRGIPTIHVPHANCFYTGEGWDIHTESISDFILASGEYSRQWYTGRGYTGDIRVTGSPQLDGAYSEHQVSKTEARQVLGIHPDDFVLIGATTWGQLTSDRGGFEKEHEDKFARLLDAAKRMRATLCITLHPGEAQGIEQMYMEKIKAAGVKGFCVRGYTEYVLKAGDVLVLTATSNLISPAIMCRLPVVYYNTEGFSYPDGPTPVTVDEDLVEAIRRAKETDWGTWEGFLKLLNDRHGSEVTATERTSAAIQEIVCHQPLSNTLPTNI